MRIILPAVFLFLSISCSLCRADITTGLVGWWKFDEGTGTSAADSSGNGNTGTLQNSPPWINGKIRDALSFNGSSQYVDIANLNPTTSLSGSYTVSAWVLSTAATSDTWRPFLGDKSGAVVFFVGGESGNNNRVAVNFNAVSNNNISGSFTLNDGLWHLIVVIVVPASSITVYYDNMQIFSGLSPGAQGTTGIDIGSDQRSQYWKGSIDDIRVYNRALSASDVAQLYAAHTTQLSHAHLSHFHTNY